MTEASVGRQYDRWLRSRSPSSRGYAFLASVPGLLVINTPAYRFDKTLALKPEQRLIDIGCGPGSLLQVVAARVHFHSLPVGLDLSREMLDRALRSAPTGGIRLVQGACTRLPFLDNSFDIATSGYMLKHLDGPSLDLFLRELLRIIKPGGLALLWEFAPTRSSRLDALNKWVVTRGVEACNLRPFSQIAAAATRAGFDWVDNANLRPFLFPPIPRLSLAIGKAPEGWRERTGLGRARHSALHAS